MSELTFLTLDQTGVTGHLRESSNNKRLYEIYANTNTSLNNIRLNSDVIHSNQQGLSFVCITNNQVSLYRVYNIFNNAELSSINNIFNYACDFIIISSNVTLPSTVVDILRYRGSKILYSSPNTCYIGLYNQRFGILTKEIQKSESAFMDFTGIITEGITYTSNNSYTIPKSEYIIKVVIDSITELSINYTPKLSDGLYTNITISDNQIILLIDADSDIIINSVDGSVFNIIDISFLNGEDSSAGIYGFNSGLFIETDEDILLRIFDKKESTGGVWYTKKENNVWILETDDLGNPIEKWYVSNPSSVIRENTIYSKYFREF